MGRAVLVVSGVVAAILGIVLIAAGVVVAVAFGPSGRVASEPTTVTGTGVALLLDDLTVDAVGLPVPDGIGVLSLTAGATDGVPVFLGAATTDDVDAYLTGAPYDVVLAALPPGGVAQTRPVPGTQQAPPPLSQQFWLRQDSGATARITARVPTGTTVVVMAEDATPGHAMRLGVTLEVDRAWPAALVAMSAGLLLVAFGIVLFVLARRRGSRPQGAHSAGAATATTVLPGGTAPLGHGTDPDASDAPGTAGDG